MNVSLRKSTISGAGTSSCRFGGLVRCVCILKPRFGESEMSMPTVGEKISFIERLRTSTPINKQAALVVSVARKYCDQEGIDPVDFLSKVFGPQVREQPRAIQRIGEGLRIGMRVGSLVVIGGLDQRIVKELKWPKGNKFLVRCDCGNYESRKAVDLHRPCRKEYIDACTWCKGYWAEYVKAEHRRTGQWPEGGGPTCRESQFGVDESEKRCSVA